MAKLMKLIFFAAAFGIVLWLAMAPAQAAEVTLNWTNATENEDNTPIVATGPGSLASTTMKWGACNPDDTPALPLLEHTVPTTIPGNSETTTVTIFTPGRWCFVAYHTNQGDPANSVDPMNSVDSNTAFKVIVMVPDGPASLTVVITDLTVYDIVKQLNKYVLLAVGEVPGGTTCDPDEYVNGHFVVPNSAVTWFGNVRPPVVVANCS